MAYLDDLLKGSTKAINNFDSLGGYSPLYGFSNEDELAKNPYQQILSSAPKEQTYNLSNPLNSGWLENRNMFNSNGNSFQTEYVIWSNFGLMAEDMDLQSYQLSARVLLITI